MTAQTDQKTPEQLARESFEVIFERKDIDAARRFWGPESVDHFLALGLTATGPDELAAFFSELHAALPDLEMTIENLVTDDRRSVVQWRLTATFDGGPFQGIEPTGKPVELRGCDVFTWTADGLVDENTVYYDGAEFARQIGMLPKRDSAADKGVLAAFNAGQKLRRRLGR